MYETCLFAILVSFPQPILSRELGWMYFNCSNLYLLTGHIISTLNLNINVNKKCGEAIKGPFEKHQGTVKGPFVSAQCSQPCLIGTTAKPRVLIQSLFLVALGLVFRIDQELTYSSEMGGKISLFSHDESQETILE